MPYSGAGKKSDVLATHLLFFPFGKYIVNTLYNLRVMTESTSTGEFEMT